MTSGSPFQLNHSVILCSLLLLAHEVRVEVPAGQGMPGNSVPKRAVLWQAQRGD